MRKEEVFMCFELRGRPIYTDKGGYIGKVEDVALEKKKNNLVVTALVTQKRGNRAVMTSVAPPYTFVKKISRDKIVIRAITYREMITLLKKGQVKEIEIGKDTKIVKWHGKIMVKKGKEMIELKKALKMKLPI